MAKDIYDAVITAKDLGRMFGLTDKRIRQLSQDRTIPWIQNEPQYLYRVGDAVRSYVEHLKKENAKKGVSLEDEDLNHRKLVADVKKAEYDAKIKENQAALSKLNLDEQRGNLHYSQDVEDAMTEMVTTIKAGIQSLHGKLGIKISSKLNADPAVCIDLVRDAEDEILNELYEHQYSEDFFRQKIHEREVLEEIEKEDLRNEKET